MKNDFLREESSFGYHADLHLSPEDLDAGTRAIPDELEKSLRILMPDWVQVDSKGHRGWTSFFSKVPEASVCPHLKHDAVAAWREATDRLGLQLIAHYSSFWDASAATRHPEWLTVLRPGAVRKEPLSFREACMCPRSDYFDKLMIPQLIELACDYRADGVWLDSDCAFNGCWCDKCKAEFTRRTGLSEIPGEPGEKNWEEWFEFTKASYQEIIRHCIEKIKMAAPGFRICCNWMDTTSFPMEPPLPVDWISGDLAACWNKDTVEFESRWLANREKPWDLMSWAHLGFPNFHLKSSDMLCQEAAPAVAAGGRYLFCENMGGIRSSQQVNWRMRQFRQVRDFVKARSPFCRGAKGIPEVAVLHDRPSNHQREEFVSPSSKWACAALCDLHYGVDIFDEQKLLPRIGEYKVIVVPEETLLSAGMVEALKKYVDNGGRLLVSGVDRIELFGADYFGFTDWKVESVSFMFNQVWSFEFRKDKEPLYFLSNGADGVFPLSSTKWGLAKSESAAETERVFASYVPEESETGYTAFSMKRHGKGFAGAVPADVFNGYMKHFFLPECRRFIGRVMKHILPERFVEVEGPSTVDVMFRSKNGNTYIHMMNRNSGNAYTMGRCMVDEIPAVGPVTLKVHLDDKPAAIRLQPSGKTPEYEWMPAEGGSKGTAVITVPSVRIMESVEIQHREG